MDKYGFTWEAFKVHTEDGFILTTFHITGDGQTMFEPTMPPVIFQHGDYSDAAFWMDAYPSGLPLQLILAQKGYDVWCGNNRGTEYSTEHETLSPDEE